MKEHKISNVILGVTYSAQTFTVELVTLQTISLFLVEISLFLRVACIKNY